MKIIRPVIITTLFLTYHDAIADQECAPIITVPDFDLVEFSKARWYVHQQAPTKYVPIERNYCSFAEYNIIDGKPTFPWGYTVKVNNYAEDKDGQNYGGELCAYQPDPVTVSEKSKLAVAPCKIPKIVAGPYWVVAYNEEEGYALVSGGQPTIKTDKGCKTGEGVLESGLWIFLRTRERSEETIQKVRDIAEGMEFDLSVLNDVSQTNCKSVEEVGVVFSEKEE